MKSEHASNLFLHIPYTVLVAVTCFSVPDFQKCLFSFICKSSGKHLVSRQSLEIWCDTTFEIWSFLGT